MYAFWIEYDDFEAAMRQLSDLLSMSLETEEIENLKAGLADTWYSTPWLLVPRVGLHGVQIELAKDEIPGVFIRAVGQPEELRRIGVMLAKYNPLNLGVIGEP